LLPRKLTCVLKTFVNGLFYKISNTTFKENIKYYKKNQLLFLFL